MATCWVIILTHSLYNMIVIDELLKIRGRQNLDPAELHISGSDPVLDSPFKLGEVAAAAHAAVGVAVNDLWEQKTGRRQKIQISVRSAAASLKSNKYAEIRHKTGGYCNLVDKEHEFNRQLNGIYRAKDGRWVLHFGLNHLKIECWLCWKRILINLYIASSFKMGRDRFGKCNCRIQSLWGNDPN